jgi:hypothetical protein
MTLPMPPRRRRKRRDDAASLEKLRQTVRADPEALVQMSIRVPAWLKLWLDEQPYLDGGNVSTTVSVWIREKVTSAQAKSPGRPSPLDGARRESR